MSFAGLARYRFTNPSTGKAGCITCAQPLTDEEEKQDVHVCTTCRGPDLCDDDDDEMSIPDEEQNRCTVCNKLTRNYIMLCGGCVVGSGKICSEACEKIHDDTLDKRHANKQQMSSLIAIKSAGNKNLATTVSQYSQSFGTEFAWKIMYKQMKEDRLTRTRDAYIYRIFSHNSCPLIVRKWLGLAPNVESAETDHFQCPPQLLSDKELEQKKHEEEKKKIPLSERRKNWVCPCCQPIDREAKRRKREENDIFCQTLPADFFIASRSTTDSYMYSVVSLRDLCSTESTGTFDFYMSSHGLGEEWICRGFEKKEEADAWARDRRTMFPYEDSDIKVSDVHKEARKHMIEWMSDKNNFARLAGSETSTPMQSAFFPNGPDVNDLNYHFAKVEVYERRLWDERRYELELIKKFEAGPGPLFPKDKFSMGDLGPVRRSKKHHVFAVDTAIVDCRPHQDNFFVRIVQVPTPSRPTKKNPNPEDPIKSVNARKPFMGWPSGGTSVSIPRLDMPEMPIELNKILWEVFPACKDELIDIFSSQT